VEELVYSLDVWKKVKELGNTPVLIRGFKDIWKDGNCLTVGEFILCTYRLDAHPNGVVYCQFFRLMLMTDIDLYG
jgi:hypothetical protein